MAHMTPFRTSKEKDRLSKPFMINIETIIETEWDHHRQYLRCSILKDGTEVLHMNQWKTMEEVLIFHFTHLLK